MTATWLRECALTLAIAASGGVLAGIAGIPAGWLAGPMIAVAAAAVLRVPVAMPTSLRDGGFAILGTMIGTTLDRRTLEALPEWPVSIAGLVIGIAIMLAVIPAWLHRLHGIDRKTARMCAMPGAMAFVILHAIETGADSRRVAILQILRLSTMLLVVPGLFAVIYGTGAPRASGDIPSLSWPVALGLVAAGYAALPLARRLRFPAPAFFAPMCLSAGLSLTGWFDRGPLPLELMLPALIVSGAAIGSRFRGTSPRYLLESVRAGLGSVILAVAISGILAWIVARITSFPFLQVLLAYAPGGIEMMTVLSLSLGLDPAFVAGHQLMRFVAVCLILPFLVTRS